MNAHRLLLVEDNDLVARVVARSLRSVDVVVADTGERALARLSEDRFGMALVDVSLDKPERTQWRSGVQLALEMVRRHPDLKGRVYLFTGHSRSQQEVRESGLPIVEKPIIDIRSFRQMVSDTVAR